ncbi:MAG TPA: helix-turn-helix domain-containing protein [Oscillospiraceae bacterium]|nr:helix-turn-helix domain-containing protein [Oscillospiraceae bacterium]
MKKLATQQAILAAAKELFIANGYKGTTTVQIAKQAGISEMTLFRHFAKKEDIFLQVIAPVISFLDQLAVAKQQNIQQTVREMLQNRLLFLLEEKELVRLVVLESYVGEGQSNPIVEVVQKLEEHFTALQTDERELLIRLIAGFILSGIFLPKNKSSDMQMMESLLQSVIYPLLDSFTHGQEEMKNVTKDS